MFAIAENNFLPTMYMYIRPSCALLPAIYYIPIASDGWAGICCVLQPGLLLELNTGRTELGPPRPIAIGSCWHISHWADAGRCLDRPGNCMYVACSLAIEPAGVNAFGSPDGSLSMYVCMYVCIRNVEIDRGRA